MTDLADLMIALVLGMLTAGLACIIVWMAFGAMLAFFGLA